MLKTLKIKNVALIEEASVNFDEKLNIISGETGAGKSVLLDAINLILGAKADKALIKSGEDFLKVDATFVNCDSKEISNLFADFGLEVDNCIIISRKISTDSKNEIKVNGETVPLSFLKSLGAKLIDIHSQNENLTLLNKTNQLKLLDDYLKTDFTLISNLFNELKELNNKINELDGGQDLRERELDLLSFQIKEIEDAKLISGEENELENELILLKNSEKINNSLNSIKELYLNNAFSIASNLRKMSLELANLEKYNENINVLEDRLNSADIEIADIYEEILSTFNLEFNSQRFEEIDARLDLYKKLHKKYGNSYEDITNFLNKSIERRDYLLNYEEELLKLNKNKKETLSKLFALCKDLTNKRKTGAKILEEKILSELKELSMPHCQITFKFEDYDEVGFENCLTNKGADSVELLFSANLGESVKPLNMVASGGEISRLMLAIKTITSENDGVFTMIFDELDTGISGEASVSTSKKLAKISKNHQIIAVSHLFQICAMADKNILVKKIEENAKTFSSITELKLEETVIELCRFLSVNGVTENSLKNAQEVKDFCDNYKNSIRKKC